MSCVPIETNSFKVGPRDYLNQFLGLISTLRGGDSRYLPLLLAKINEALPAMAAPVTHSLPLLPVDERLRETYESSASSDSTPYSSPSTTGLDFPDLTSSMSCIGITSGAPFTGSSTVAAAPPLYHTANAHGYSG